MNNHVCLNALNLCLSFCCFGLEHYDLDLNCSLVKTVTDICVAKHFLWNIDGVIRTS